MDETDAALEKAWASTCRVLFGEELGALPQYHAWLSDLVDLPIVRKSALSGKDVIYSTNDYPKAAKPISLDEVDLNRKFPPLSINQVKDIESIVAAIQDRTYYAGSMVLGNSKFVKGCSNINDSFYMQSTTLSGNDKYMAYCTLARLDSYGFGGNAFSQCEFCLKCHELTRVKRSFELWMSQDSADCYYSHGLKNCTSCMFSFNIQNKRFCIGNVELSPEKYKEIRAKLLSEMVGAAKRDRRLPSLIEIVGKAKAVAPKITLANAAPCAPLDKSKIEAAFASTMQIIFGKRPSKGIDAYGAWLVKHTRGFDRCKSASSGKEIYLAHYGNYCDLPKDRLLTLEEAKQSGQSAKLLQSDLEGFGLANAGAKLSKIAFFNSDISDGNNMNDIECTINIDAVNCYCSVCSVYSKFAAYSFWPRTCEHVFGCDTVFDSSFCVDCYRGVKLTRCLEMDSCNACSDCLYCHNCENMQNCMFCFNAKNKSYAVGNAEMGREAYLQAKKRVVEQLAGELDKDCKLGFDIFAL
ncbi:MAG: hypothetical protein NTX79_07695 [Candidatus Micrarchaeota archaeon]|nr:hypothetical protein [Candidatus Micrarchaeota archaeon]